MASKAASTDKLGATVEDMPTEAMQKIAKELGAAEGPKERIKVLLSLAETMPVMPEEAKTMRNRVMGCTAQVCSFPPCHHACMPRINAAPPLDQALTRSRSLPPPPPQVWLTAELSADGTVQLTADSDSDVTRGLCAVLVKGLAGLKPSELIEVMCLTLVLPRPKRPLLSSPTAW